MFVTEPQVELVARQVFDVAGVVGFLNAHELGWEELRRKIDSDLDLGLLLAEDPPSAFDGLPLDLEADLETHLGRPVQVVTLNRAPADLVHRVLRDGVLVLEDKSDAMPRIEIRDIGRNKKIGKDELENAVRRVQQRATDTQPR